MTPYELADRDLRKARLSLSQAMKKPNVPDLEIKHLEELCMLRKLILEIVRKEGATDERAD